MWYIMPESIWRTDTSCDGCFTNVYKNLSGKSIYKTYKSNIYLFLTKVVFCIRYEPTLHFTQVLKHIHAFIMHFPYKCYTTKCLQSTNIDSATGTLQLVT